jgi:acetyl esterase
MLSLMPGQQYAGFAPMPTSLVSIASGGSAGGHLAACCGLLRTSDPVEREAEVSYQPNALVLFNPVVDTTEKGFGKEKVGVRYRDLSVVDHIAPHGPPAIVFHGTDDSIVPYENVERFKSNMEAAGNTCRLIPFEGLEHGFFNFAREDKGPFEKTLGAAREFLIAEGFGP